jgi:hypothetical protein
MQELGWTEGRNCGWTFALGSRQHLITAFWEYLILLEVAYKLLENMRQAWR